MQEQMYLCTLTPFKESSPDFDGSVECAVAIHWRYNEVKFTCSNVSTSIPVTSMKSSSWLNLCGSPFCRLSAVLRSDMVPLGIRIHLVKDSIVNILGDKSQSLSQDHVQFHTFEANLESILGSHAYVVETFAKKKPFDATVHKNVEVPVGLKITEGLYWSFRDLTFTRECPEPFIVQTMRPTVLVSDCTEDWREQVLGLGPKKKPVVTATDLVPMHHATLVVTLEPEKWHSESCLEFQSRGLPVCDMAHTNLFTVHPNFVQSNITSAYNLFESIEYAMKSTTGQVHRTKSQVKRVICENLIQKFPSFVVPLNLVQFGCIVYDDIDLVGHITSYLLESQALRYIQVCKSNLTKPKNLTRDQLVKCFTCRAPFAVPHVDAILDSSFLTIPVPKTILRKFRILGHLVKNGPVEDRIAKMFSQRYSPVSENDSIQRFSGRAMPKDFAKSLIERHFQRTTVSLATFVETTSVSEAPISSAYVLRSLETAQQCCVCFETTESPTFTICGHTYCKDCSRQHFSTEWASGKSKECGQCRHLLSQGDTFVLGAFSEDKPFVPSVSSMMSSLQNFLSGCRIEPKTWDPDMDYETSVKTLISSTVSKIDPRDILKKFSTTQHQTMTLHVFYLQEESNDFGRLQNAFKL